MVQAEIKDTFKVGIYTTKLELDKKNLTNFCNVTEQKNKSIFVSNTGYQSNIFYSKDSVVIDLQKEILEHRNVPHIHTIQGKPHNSDATVMVTGLDSDLECEACSA